MPPVLEHLLLIAAGVFLMLILGLAAALTAVVWLVHKHDDD